MQHRNEPWVSPIAKYVSDDNAVAFPHVSNRINPFAVFMFQDFVGEPVFVSCGKICEPAGPFENRSITRVIPALDAVDVPQVFDGRTLTINIQGFEFASLSREHTSDHGILRLS